MLKRKSPLAAIGLATGAMALQPVIQRYLQTLNVASINSAALQTNWATVQRFFILEVQPMWPVIQKAMENGYLHLTALNFWSYLVILVAVILEGPIATLLGGVWASSGRVNFLPVLEIAIVAGIMADTFWYYLGYFGREKVIDRWGRYLNLDAEAVAKMEDVLFGDEAGRVLFTTKLTSVLIIPTLIAAGMSGMGWRKVMRSMIVAQVLWSLALITIGFIAADSISVINRYVDNFGWMVFGALSLLFVGRLVYRWRRSA
jgi:membrane protein DedA with SNARE-associated domain